MNLFPRRSYFLLASLNYLMNVFPRPRAQVGRGQDYRRIVRTIWLMILTGYGSGYSQFRITTHSQAINGGDIPEPEPRIRETKPRIREL